ncbi:MAG: serine/threonine protein kinase [Myxococcales bacterium]|nr:serine/threonine protein kinase [Myxococcales bacterium]
MGPNDGTDPVALTAPIPVDGDGEELIGMVIDGRYRLEGTLGRGGMGLVYKAAHIGLRRQVAVKILHPSLAASPDVRNRFEREALAVGKIDHPNCVSVYDSGRLPDGSLYLAMELLDGKSLADVLEQEGQLAPGRALHILAGILRGLAHIHHAGLIHRDIKPENIFLVRQGEDLDFAKILDFGIAKPMAASDLDDGVKLTQAGMAFGTPIYMAPEQALGNPMDGRADLYAASVMAYEMLAGAPPFYSDDKLEVMSMHTARPVPPMRQRMIKGGRPIPSSIERLVVRGLTKKPAERYATAEVYLAAVEEALRTPDGGVTDVNFERPGDTGSQPLVSPDGQVHITGASEFASEVASESIAAAIDEELSVPKHPRVATPAKGAGGLPPAVAAANRQSQTKLPQGGVGLGLPYTGPTGEPIFGLTPEQRLAQAAAGAKAEPAFVTGSSSGVANALEPEPQAKTTLRPKTPSKPRWGLYGAIAGAAIVIGVVIAIVTRPGGGGSGDDGLDLDPESLAGQANAALAEGRPDRAIQILEGNKVAIARDPVAQLILGHAHAAKHASGPSLYAYGEALKQKPELEANPMLRANLRAMAADKDVRVVASAFELWIQTSDPEARPLLLKAAVSQDLERRHAVRPLIDRRDLTDQVDLVAAYSLDLEQEPSCDLRKTAVARLRALNYPRAESALERALVRKIKSGSMRNKPYSPCLLDDAKAAIGYLRGLPPKQQKS